MSGIFLPRVELPEDGNWLTLRIYASGEVVRPNWRGDGTFLCKAIPVHTNGRLIDADKEYERVKGQYEMAISRNPEAGCVNVYQGEMAVLELAPTVIPAHYVTTKTEEEQK